MMTEYLPDPVCQNDRQDSLMQPLLVAHVWDQTDLLIQLGVPPRETSGGKKAAPVF